MKPTIFRENSSLILIIYLTTAIFVIITAPILTTQWGQKPFIGGFLTPTLQLASAPKIIPYETWPVQELGLNLNDQLIALDGEVVQSSLDVTNSLSNMQSGDEVTLTISSHSGSEFLIEITLIPFSAAARLLYIYIPSLAAVVCFLSGLWVYSDQRKDTINVVYSIFMTSIAIMLSTYFDFFSVHRLVPMFLISIGIAAASLIQIALLLPWQNHTPKKHPWLNYIAYPLNFILVGIAIYQLYHPSIGPGIFTFFWILLGSLCLSMLVLIYTFLMNRLRSSSLFIKVRTQQLLLASSCSFFPILIHYFMNLLDNSVLNINPLFFIPLCIFPITYTLTSRRFLLPQTKQSVHRTLLYILISILFGIIYLILVSVINTVLISPITPDNPLVIGIMIILVILTIQPIHKLFERFFINQATSTQRSNELALKYASSLTTTNNKAIANELLRDAIREIIYPEHVHVYLYDSEIPGYIAKTYPETTKEDCSVVPRDSVIATTLEKLHDILYFKQEGGEDGGDESGQRLWDKHGSIIFAPIPATYGILGWLAIGPKRNHIPYTAEDIDLIRTLTHQFSVVYERADALISIRTSLHEMEILNQIAVAINDNNDIDSLLISTFKQIQSLIHIDQLSLVMESGEEEGVFQHLFLYENGKIVISTHQPKRLTDDFLEKHSISEGNAEIIIQDINWLVVPIKAEDRIIGAISLGHSGDRALFDHINLNLIDSIASLMSGAIIKANLLQSTQQQAEQLAMLNKVSHQLTSTLILEPLLKNILNGALEILTSSSGILMTIDEIKDELEFKVAAGPIGTPLIGHRLPSDKGIAGESYTKQTPVIKNEIDPKALWFKETNPEIISQIQNILAVPLITQGKVVGILEIINKKNDVPYTQNDLTILKGFASQAAIAIHNATLYTETDRALEERIEELYTMQQIDRELNSTRDMSLAMEITLKSALQNTHAEAGLIGIIDVEEEFIEEVYQILPEKEEFTKRNQINFNDFPWFSEVSRDKHEIITSENISEALDISDKYQAHYLRKSELEETEFIILMLHLDTATKLDNGDLDFLNRLGDHAFLALKNTFLYQELHDAIQKKNEFISYISHELKNPLTVIKGYADILRKGMAGDINEEQVDFLTTITHNVRQMSTFITDLSDQSRIETRSLRLMFDTSSVQEIIDEVLHTYENQINEKSLTVLVQTEKDTPDVWCDRLRLIQILSNLVSNAVKYTPEGGRIQLGAHHAINQWDDKGAAEVIHFWVEDNGYGISQEDQSHLFEKFFRGTREQITKKPGSGLGLRISKTLTEMMGGKMWFESTEGKGSTFHFTMPI